MRKQILFYALILLSINLFAQQRPHYTQYILNNYILNPALSGIENYTDLKLSGRDQWIGLNGAPKTFYVTVNMPLGKKDYKTSATSFNIPGENPRGRSYWESYNASEPHHGVGLTVVNDKTGLYNRFTASGTYAYHLGLSPSMNLAAGFSAGMGMVSYDKLKAQFADPLDPVISSNSNELNKMRPDIGAGLWLYTSDYFVGLSAQQIIPQKVIFSDNAITEGNKFIPHLFATAGYRFLMSEDINAVPSIMLKYVKGSPATPQFDLNMKLQFRDLLWVGASYRLEDGYAAMLGLNVANSFNFGYSFDFTKTRLNTASKGTHELIIGFLIGNRYGDTCPRNIW